MFGFLTIPMGLMGMWLCLGSLASFLGYYLVHEHSFCWLQPCQTTSDRFVQGLPLVSYFISCSHCTVCAPYRSYVHIFIEFLSLLVAFLIFYTFTFTRACVYYLYSLALCITIRSDMETMLISRYVTLCLVPAFVGAAWANLLPISYVLSISGCIFGYTILKIINYIFYTLTERQGIGEGDYDLLALIGSVSGPVGVWFAMFCGSCLGMIYALIYYVSYHKKISMIPFGPFLAFSALIYMFIGQFITAFFFHF